MDFAAKRAASGIDGSSAAKGRLAHVSIRQCEEPHLRIDQRRHL